MISGCKQALLLITPRVTVQRQVLSEGTREAGATWPRATGDGQHQFLELIWLRLFAIDVQARADLRFFEFAQIAINAVETFFKTRLRWVEVELAKARLQALAQQFAPFASQLDGLPILIHEPFQLSERTMQTSPSQRRGEMVEDQGLASAFGLGSLTGVIHDEGIEVGHWPQAQLRETGRALAHPFARKPFEIAVFTQMDHGMGRELLLDPDVVGEVGVGRRQIGGVVIEAWVAVVATRGLQDHADVAVALR